MLCKIKKRNGLVVDFCVSKIENAILRALQSTDSDVSVSSMLAGKVSTIAEALFDKKTPSVEDIQDITEQILINEGYGKTAKSFILYRNQHTRLRNEKHLIENYIDLVDNYLGLNDWKVNENSNMGYSLQGLNNYISSHISSNYWLHKIYDEEIADEHLSGHMHIHDLGLLGSYCSGWDLFDLLQIGLRGVDGKIESDPPKHLRSALGQIVNFFYTLQGEAAGAQAFSNFDTLVAPFIRYDNLTQREVKQHMQEFIFNVNVPTRVGFQCVSEDTEILTCDGWKNYNEVKIGDKIKNFNMQKYRIEKQVVKHVHVSHYTGEMYALKSDKTDQLISPNHRVVYFDAGNFYKQTIEECLRKEILQIPVMCEESSLFEFTKIEISKIQYDGIIWCPNTNNETIIARRNGKVFITGNTPFTNITMDLQPPGYYQDMPVIIGGQPQKETYKEFQKEMDMLNDAFCEVMMEGDAKGRIFTFPIPTYNLTKDFDWDNPNLKGLWKMTSKYGTPYFANFINSDMSVDDSRSMCCLPGNTHITYIEDNIIKEDKIQYIVDRMLAHNLQYKILVNNTRFEYTKSPIKFRYIGDMIEITLANDIIQSFTYDHPCLTEKGIINAENLSLADFIALRTDEDKFHYEPIKNIRCFKIDDYVYDFEMDSDDHLFSLSNGIVTHNCRLRLDNRELRKRGGGLFASNPMTGSIGVVTINLPKHAYESKEKSVFFESVYNSLLVARKSLSIKRKVLEKYTENGLYPYARFYLSKIKNSKRNQYWSNHFNTIGVIGMNEACLNLINQTIATPEGTQLAIETLEFIREKLTEFQEQDDMMYNLEATPGEGTSYRLAQIDKRQYPNIKTSGITEPYYTNSTALPVNQTTDLFDALAHQDQILPLYTGGSVHHGFIGEQIHDPNVCKELVKKVANMFKIPYFTITPTFSICPTHGYIAGEHHNCPVITKLRQQEEVTA